MTGDAMSNPSEPKPIEERLAEWLYSEGYPTEFRTANLFQRNGFAASQGYFVEGEADDLKREIDVLASSTIRTKYGFLRVSYVVECKWSGDKPWIVFTSPTNIMAPSALIAQTISSKLGAAAMWIAAGNATLTNLSTFSTPRRGGFGGRQAFSKGNDHFYSAVQSVVGNASHYAAWYDRGTRDPGKMPESCVIVFPIVVVEGDLYEAYFNKNTEKVDLRKSGHIRCHWKGSTAWNFFASVDIVSLDHLDIFLLERSSELKPLSDTLVPVLDEIEAFRKHALRESINITEGPRGFRGLPPLLREFQVASGMKL